MDEIKKAAAAPAVTPEIPAISYGPHTSKGIHRSKTEIALSKFHEAYQRHDEKLKEWFEAQKNLNQNPGDEFYQREYKRLHAEVMALRDEVKKRDREAFIAEQERNFDARFKRIRKGEA